VRARRDQTWVFPRAVGPHVVTPPADEYSGRHTMLSRHFISAICMAIALGASSVAEAQTIRYSISGMFGDGASLRGKFTIDWRHQTLTKYRITTTRGVLSNILGVKSPTPGFTYTRAEPLFYSRPPAIWGSTLTPLPPTCGFTVWISM
jgi:hypothetical protein